VKQSLYLPLLFLIISLNAWAAVPNCGEHPAEDRKYDWLKISDMKMFAPGTKVDGIICAATMKGNSARLVHVVYRDDRGTVKSYTVEALKIKRQIVLTDRDLNMGIVRKGNIMGLKIEKETLSSEQTTYQFNLRFLRNLSRWSGKRDHRELRMLLTKPHQSDNVVVTIAGEKVEFNMLEIHISLGLNIQKMRLKDFEILRKEIATKTLPKVDKL